nr:MAG: ORF1 [Giant panda anellovirus]
MVRFYRRYWRRRRPYTRRGYRRLRPWIRRRYWRRHPWVRRLRRRRYRKRQYVGALVQWHPRHRALCTIKGWGIAMYGRETNTTTNFSAWVQPTGNLPGYYKLYGGGASLYHLTLDWLYSEHLKGHNIWSRSNESFDLARYFGTTFYLPPHPTLDYVFWWRTDYGTLKKYDYEYLHPAVAILNPKHIIVKSIQHGGRRTKRVRVAPPSVHNSQWYFMKQWCNAGLLRFGFTLINLDKMFIHTGETRPWYPLGTSTSDRDVTKLPNTKPIPTTSNQVWYKYTWDTGKDNRIGYAQLDAGGTKLTQISIQSINVPYWQFYFGTGWTNFNNNMHWFWWWYNDKQSEEKFAPEDLSDKQKCWIYISRTDNKSYSDIVVPLVQKGPFVVDKQDIPGTNIFNIAFMYKSRWQWGGTNPTVPPTLDPCDQPPAGYFGDPVRIGNPATTGAAVLHPWDLDASGLITKQKLRDILRFSDTDLATTSGVQKTLPEIDGAPYREENSSSSESDWDSEANEEENDMEENSYHRLTKKISRNRRFRHELIRGLQRLLKQ